MTDTPRVQPKRNDYGESGVAEHETATGNGGSAPLPKGMRLPRTERRAQLLTAAQGVFAANGYHAAAMDDIAEQAGVSKPVLYQHFPGKLDLYIALLESHVDELVSRVEGALASTTDNKQRVQAAVGAFFDFVNGDAGAFKMVFESDLRGEPSVQEAVDRATSASVDAITETITADAGLGQDQARLLAVGLVGLSQVSARFWLANGSAISREEAVTLTSTLAWRGIGGGFPRQHFAE